MDIMLVDDSRVMRQLVRRTLRQAGYDLGQVVEAENGKDAMTKLGSFRPQLVLSDWNMPEMNGIEMLEALRAKGDKIPVGFVTSESTVSMRTKALTTGALFLLTKPFTAEEFRTALTGAGLRPSAALSGDGGPALATTIFNEKAICTMLSRLVNQPITVTPGPKVIPIAMPCVAATWVNVQGATVYCGFAELALAAYLGTAMGLRPVATVKDVLTTKQIPDTLQSDIREVFNVLSRTFNDCGSEHVRLDKISFPPGPALPAAIQFDAKAQSRKDYMVQVQGYGAGKLSIVGATPGFIVKGV